MVIDARLKPERISAPAAASRPHPPRHILSWRMIAAITGACAGAVAIIGLLVNPYGHAGWIDPFIYTGYIVDYEALLERFGPTYYSTRISSIWPSELAYSLFGHGGFLVVRAICLFALLVAVALTSFRSYGRRTAIITTSAVGSSAWLLNTFTDDYTQYSALTYAAVALAALALAPRKVWGIAACGAFTAFAANSYPLILLSLGPILLSAALVALRHREQREVGRGVLIGSAGFIGACALLGTMMAARLGWTADHFFFERRTLETAGWLTSGAQRAFAVSFVNALFPLFVLLVAAALALGAIMLMRPARRLANPRLCETALLALGMTLFAAVIGHFALGSGLLGWPYLLVMLSPSFFLALIAVVGESVHFLLPPWRWALALAAISPVIAFGLTRTGIEDVWFFILWFLGVAGTIEVFMAAVSRQLSHSDRLLRLFWTVAPVALLLAAGAAPIASGYQFVSTPHLGDNAKHFIGYRSGMGGDSAASDQDVHDIAVEFAAYVNQNVPANATLLVYQPVAPIWLTSVQATMVAGHSCLACGLPAKWPTGIVAQSRALKATEYLTVVTADRAEAENAHNQVLWSLPRFRSKSRLTELRSGPLTIWVSIYRNGAVANAG